MGEFRWYGDLLDYSNYLQYGIEEQYGITLRGEDYPTFWAREAPQVFIGNPSHDERLMAYLTDYEFLEVQPDLWFSRELCPTIDCSAVGG
jgi:hypothetical protein